MPGQSCCQTNISQNNEDKRKMSNSLEEKSQILELLSRYAWLVDARKFDEWLGLFAEDASYLVTTNENVQAGFKFGLIMETKKTLVERMVEWRKLWWTEPSVTSHIIGSPLIELIAPEDARADFYITIYKTREKQTTELLACGKCEALLRKTDGQWRIKGFRSVLDADVVPDQLDVPV